jgi:uncharacterized repeat protein (TIGR01451 family)
MTRLALVAAFSAVLAVSLARAGATASSDLAVTNTDGVTLYTAGDPVTYTIVVTNAGPDDAVGATVTDAVVALPQVASASWTCIGDLGATCASGSIAGDINDTVNVPVGGTLTYKLIVSTRPTAVGSLVAAAHVTPATGASDPDIANNTATDIDTAPVYDLSVTNTDFASVYTPGNPVTYTIVVSNAGPDPVTKATVSDVVSTIAETAGAVWTCLGAGGGTCTVGPAAGDIADTINLPVGGSVTYTLVVRTLSGTSVPLATTATVTAHAGATDPNTANNTATDTDTPAALVYAAPTGIDSDTCGLLSTPCKTIQAAIDNASAGNTVLVAAGTYSECIVLIPGVGLGGVRVESDEFLASQTVGTAIIDGTGKCDGVGGNTAGPVAKLFDGSAIQGLVIKGGGDSGVEGLGAVTIANNTITGNTSPTTGGGVRLTTGVNLLDPLGKAVIKSNTVVTNTAKGNGAGIYVSALASGVPSLVEITGNTVSTNTSVDGAPGVSGAGIAVVTDTTAATDNSRVLITGNTLDANVATSDGGGLFVATGALTGAGTETVTIGVTRGGNFIRNNKASGLGGGMSVNVRPAPGGKHSVDIEANAVSANTGTLGGGGTHLVVRAPNLIAGASPAVTAHVTDNSFTGNQALGSLSDPNAVGGGGIYAALHSDRTSSNAIVFEISGNTIERNEAATSGGGASLLVSADDDPNSDQVTAPADAEISFQHNLVARNAAHDTTAVGVSGGGMHVQAVARGALALARVSQDFLTVADNLTELGTGGLEWEEQHPADSTGLAGTTSFVLSNSIVSGNDGFGVGGTVVAGPAATVAFSYNDAFGNGSGNYEAPLTDPTGSNGNISFDPSLDALFLPRLCGPTIDQGDPAIDPALEPAPNGGRVNMGHVGNTASATRTFPDVNGDHVIDGQDLAGVAASFGASSANPRYYQPADRDLSSRVDGDDLAFVAAFYAQSCP